MTVRFVHCAFCHAIGDFQVMSMCPVCREIICRRCSHKGPLQPGRCARGKPCETAGNPTPVKTDNRGQSA